MQAWLTSVAARGSSLTGPDYHQAILNGVSERIQNGNFLHKGRTMESR